MYRARIRWHEAGRIGFRDQCSRHSGSVSKPCLLYVVLVIDSYSGGMGSSWKSCKIDRIVRVKWKKTFFFSWVRKRLKWDLNLWYKRGIARRGIILLIICRNEIEIDENDWGIRYCSKELNVARIIYNLEYLKKFRSLQEYLNLVSEKSLRI